MTEVRKHTRVTRTGRRVTVRRHKRDDSTTGISAPAGQARPDLFVVPAASPEAGWDGEVDWGEVSPFDDHHGGDDRQ